MTMSEMFRQNQLFLQPQLFLLLPAVQAQAVAEVEEEVVADEVEVVAKVAVQKNSPLTVCPIQSQIQPRYSKIVVWT